MKSKVKAVLKQRDEAFRKMREASQRAYREAHYMEQALQLGLKSMRKDPGKHEAAIAVVEHELEMIRDLDRAYLEESMIRDRKLYPAGFRAWSAFGEALDKAKGELCADCARAVLKALDAVIEAGQIEEGGALIPSRLGGPTR
jgi:hypothetical protein